jgi:hypothetical protein
MWLPPLLLLLMASWAQPATRLLCWLGCGWTSAGGEEQCYRLEVGELLRRAASSPQQVADQAGRSRQGKVLNCLLCCLTAAVYVAVVSVGANVW